MHLRLLKFVFFVVTLNIIEVQCFQNVLNSSSLLHSKLNIKDDTTTVVDIHSGKIVGRILQNIESKKQYSAFKGIPYGEIPDRFSPSVDVKKWPGIYETFDHGPKCLQYKKKVLVGSENCLFLNVYTPLLKFDFNKQTNPKKSVMVWIHGGMFHKGSGNSESFGPDFIVARDVILVTFNYRLAALGFLNLHHPKIPGNVGLKDQNLALQWVRRNIAKFGGDPDNITIFGQSAGGVSVDLHLLSPMSKGLFKRSIAISGSVFCPWAFSYDPVSKAKKFAKTISDKDTDNIEDLVQLFLKVPAEKLVETHAKTAILHRELEFNPSIENAAASGETTFFDQCFDTPIKDKLFFQGEHILGYTSQEARMYNFTQYFGNKRLNVFSEVQFNKPIDLKQQYFVKYGSKSVYYYYFAYNPKQVDVNEGVGHSKDLPYLFYKEKYYKTFTEHDMSMKNKYTTMFTNFAKYGNPSITGKDRESNIMWTASNKAGNYLHIDVSGEISMKSGRPVSLNEKDNMENKQLCSNNKPSLKSIIQYAVFGKKIF